MRMPVWFSRSAIGTALVPPNLFSARSDSVRSSPLDRESTKGELMRSKRALAVKRPSLLTRWLVRRAVDWPESWRRLAIVLLRSLQVVRIN